MLKHAREINSRRFIHDFAWLSIEKIVLEKFWEKITDTCAFFMVVWCQTHYQTLSTRKNWLLCVQNTLLAFCHTGTTKRIEKKSGRIEKAGRIKIYRVFLALRNTTGKKSVTFDWKHGWLIWLHVWIELIMHFMKQPLRSYKDYFFNKKFSISKILQKMVPSERLALRNTCVYVNV